MAKIDDKELVLQLFKDYELLKNEIAKQVIGQEDVVKHLLISVFSNGHCLLVGVPGLAKTLLVNTLSSVLDLSFKRIQFTPDLMPSDIVGAEILDEDRKFHFNKGPVFANIVLADEINRTPPKTQAALLESMQEKKVTIGGKDHLLPKPFFVLATQNPIEQEGTYPLPEAQLDRFMFMIVIDYPSINEEVRIVKETTSGLDISLNTVLNSEKIIEYQELIRRIPVADNVVEYAVNLVNKTRAKGSEATEFIKNYVEWGAGPRASQYLIIAAKCHAVLNKKFSPDIEDVKAVATPILRHRVIKNYKAEAENISIENIINEIL
tara:strand:+ start:608 stop:1570 length:963 start_codon:yes stop_codon:yes gene_type:complete